MLKCESHPNAALIEDYHAGDMICSECGLVVGDRYEINTKISIFSILNLNLKNC